MRLTNTWCRAAFGATALLLPALANAQVAKKLASEESLLLGDIPSVFGASRFLQAETEAPASVSIITSDEIATYGWLTLSDLLRTVRGFYTTNDRSYTYIGTRGFSRPGDFNSRVLLLLDGIRVNENIYGAAYVGMESIVDLQTVDRVEIIRGPASSLYGTNAFFGIINVVTLRGRARSGVKVTAKTGSFGAEEVTVRGGGRTRSGLEFLGTASRRQVRGQNLYFSEFDSPLTSRGIATDRDAEHRDRVFGKLEWGPLALEGTINLRDKDVPTASYESSFNNGRLALRDHQRNLALRYQQSDDKQSNLTASISINRYDYDGVWPYGSTILSEWAHGRWGVVEAQYSRLIRGRHRVVVGGAYTSNWRLEQGLVDEVGQPPSVFDNTTNDTQGLFALGEFRLGPRLILNGGLRYDHTPSIGSSWNPRGALIYKLGEGSALKALYGNAFREPNNFESFYNDNGRTQKGNIALTPERVTTFEALIEQVVSRHVKLTASVYRYQARQLIDIVTDPADGLFQYQNLGGVIGQGIETEAEIDFGRLTGRASYAFQRASSAQSAEGLSNSPEHLGALNLSIPLVDDRARAGLEVRGMSARVTPRNDIVGGYVVTNVVLSSRRLMKGVESSVGLFNLFDAIFSDPVGEQHLQRAIQQDGRSFRLTLGYVF